MGLRVPVQIHGHERTQLHEPRIDAPLRPAMNPGNARNQIAFKPVSGLLIASSFTLVGHPQHSTGPAISVMLRGCAGCFILGHEGNRGHTCTQGWQIASTCARVPIPARKAMTCSTYSANPTDRPRLEYPARCANR